MRYAVALRKNTDSLVKGMILFDQVGGMDGRWKRVVDEMVLPSVCCRLLFSVGSREFSLCVPAKTKKTKKIGGKLRYQTP